MGVQLLLLLESSIGSSNGAPLRWVWASLLGFLLEYHHTHLGLIYLFLTWVLLGYCLQMSDGHSGSLSWLPTVILPLFLCGLLRDATLLGVLGSLILFLKWVAKPTIPPYLGFQSYVRVSSATQLVSLVGVFGFFVIYLMVLIRDLLSSLCDSSLGECFIWGEAFPLLSTFFFLSVSDLMLGSSFFLFSYVNGKPLFPELFLPISWPPLPENLFHASSA